MIDRTDLVELVADLASLPGPPGREGPVLAFIRARLAAGEWPLVTDGAGEAIGGEAGNARLILPGKPSLPRLLFLAHLDATAPRPARPVRDGAYLRPGGGPFAADDRVGLALLLAMLDGLPPAEERGTVEVILTVAEEAGLLGARQLSARELGADCAFVVDGPGPPGAIVIQGAAGREFRAAISARRDRDGRSVGPEPRWVANRALARLPVGETADGAYLKVWTEDNGAEIILTGAVYARSEEEVKRRLELVRAILRESAARYGLDHTFQTGRGYPDYYQPVSAPVVQLAVSAAKHVLAKPLLLQHRWASDANILNGLGIPAVCLGGAWHEEPDGTPWCHVDELSRGVEFLLALVALAATRPVRR